MLRSLSSDFEGQQVCSIFQLVQAFKRGDLDAAERLIRLYGKNFKLYPNQGYRLLLRAMATRNLDVARFLLDRGAAVNSDTLRPSYLREETLLQLALMHEDIELFKIILSRGSNVNDHGGVDNETALHTAVQLNNLEAVQLLLEHKSDINSVDKYNRTPLLASIEARTDSLPMLQLLFKYCPDLSIQVSSCKSGKYHEFNSGRAAEIGMDALFYAILFKRTDTIIYLLEHGADINLIDSYHRTPLVLACILGDEDTCRLLIDRGCDINLPGGCAETPLHRACAHSHDTIVKLLLTSGSDFNANTVGWTPLHAIFYRLYEHFEEFISLKPVNHSNVFHTLLDYGVDLNAHIKFDETLERSAVIESVSGPIPYFTAITPLHMAVSICLRYDKVDPIFLELLLEYGADVNMLDATMYSPLYHAVMGNYVGLFSFLMCYGADVSQRCKEDTPLSEICWVIDESHPSIKAMYMTAIKWKTLGLATISEEDMTSLQPDALTFFKTFEQQCQSELDDINNFNSSLYLLLTKPINDIPYLAECEIMDDICCKTMEDRFPLYQSIMSLRLRRVKFRSSLLQQCKDFRDWLDGFLPDCATLIVSYLGNRDLRRLSTW